jgi:hypothetical protein
MKRLSGIKTLLAPFKRWVVAVLKMDNNFYQEHGSVSKYGYGARKTAYTYESNNDISTV